jgi:pyruvate dehydrogenase E1 component beta subunit
VFAPGTPAEIDAAVHLALTGQDPTVIVDHVRLVDAQGTVPVVPSESLSIAMVRSGSDVLLVTYSLMVQRSLLVADQLATEGISAGVLSVPCLNPLPVSRLLGAISEFDHVLVVDEAPANGSPGSSIMAHMLAADVGCRAALVAAHAAPAPHALHLLDEVVPTSERIASSARELLDLPARR